MCDCFIIAQCLIVQVYFILACAKGVVGGAISGAVQLVVFFAVAVALLPQDIGVTYYSAARTKMLGPWLKTLVMLLLPVPLLTWPLWAALGGLVVGFGTSAAYLISGRAKGSGSGGWPGVMDWLCLPITGWRRAYVATGHNIRGFVDFNCNSYFVYLREVRDHPGPPFDINPLRLIAALGVALVGLVLGLACSLLQIPKFPFILFKVWYDIITAYVVDLKSFTDRVLLLVPFLLAIALVPVGLALGLVFLILGCLVTGFTLAGIKGYQAPTTADMAWHGVAYVWNLFYELERGLDDYVGFRCLSVFAFKLMVPEYNAKGKPMLDDVEEIVGEGTAGKPRAAEGEREDTGRVTVVIAPPDEATPDHVSISIVVRPSDSEAPPPAERGSAEEAGQAQHRQEEEGASVAAAADDAAKE